MSLVRITFALASVLVLLAPATPAKEGSRHGIKSFAFDFTPSQDRVPGLPALRIAVTVTDGGGSVERWAQNAADVTEGLEADERERILGGRYTTLGLANRWLGDKPRAELVADALRQDLTAMGVVVVAAPDLAAAGGSLPAATAAIPETARPDILLAVRLADFWFDTTTNESNMLLKVRMKAEVAATDARSGGLLWSGTVDATNIHSRSWAMTKGSVENWLNEDFRALVEGVLRTNERLQRALAR